MRSLVIGGGTESCEGLGPLEQRLGSNPGYYAEREPMGSGRGGPVGLGKSAKKRRRGNGDNQGRNPELVVQGVRLGYIQPITILLSPTALAIHQS